MPYNKSLMRITTSFDRWASPGYRILYSTGGII